MDVKGKIGSEEAQMFIVYLEQEMKEKCWKKTKNASGKNKRK